MLMELLSKAATVAMLIWVVFSMLAMGTGLTLARIIERLRNVRLVLLALLANFVLMPIGAAARFASAALIIPSMFSWPKLHRRKTGVEKGLLEMIYSHCYLPSLPTTWAMNRRRETGRGSGVSIKI